MKPFFTYYGGKHRVSGHLLPPEHEHVVEAFAGSAGYATRYPDHKVILCEINPQIAALWRYLVRVSSAEIRSIPDVPLDGSVHDLRVCDEAKSLVGFWLNKGASRPMITPAAWMRKGTHATSFWGERIRERVASQVDQIRHWQIFECSYAELKFADAATWIVDPPYQGSAGAHYVYNNKRVDYAHLGAWVRARQGLVFAHEGPDATYLPFAHWSDSKANPSANGGKVSREYLYAQIDGKPFYAEGLA